MCRVQPSCRIQLKEVLRVTEKIIHDVSYSRRAAGVSPLSIIGTLLERREKKKTLLFLWIMKLRSLTFASPYVHWYHRFQHKSTRSNQLSSVKYCTIIYLVFKWFNQYWSVVIWVQTVSCVWELVSLWTEFHSNTLQKYALNVQDKHRKNLY